MEPRLYTHAPAARRQRHCADFSVAWRSCTFYQVSSGC